MPTSADLAPRPSVDGRQRTAKARETFLNSFSTPEDRAEFYRTMGQRSSADRLTLTGEQRRCLAQAYRLLAEIVAAHPQKLGDPPENVDAASEKPAASSGGLG